MVNTTAVIIVGVVVIGLLAVGSTTSLLLRRRARSGAHVTPESGVSGPQGSSALQHTAPIRGPHVTIRDFAFYPQLLEVRAGTTVTWTNEDSAQHTVTFRTGMADSGLLSQGQTCQFTFSTLGTFAYYCRVHPHMVGTVRVTSA
jgi:plastocyanin